MAIVEAGDRGSFPVARDRPISGWQNKLAVQTFTHDSSVLTEDERKRITEWNEQCKSDDQITDDPNFIRQIVLADIQSGAKRNFRRYADAWVRRFAIAPKWSVSRIPIWAGAALFVFWAVITVQLIRFPTLDLAPIAPDWFKLVPLKHEPLPK